MDITNLLNSQVTVGASSAFFGALFAFLFGIITYYLTRWSKRQKENYDAMVKLEGLLNDHLNITFGDELLINASIQTLSSGHLTYNVIRYYRNIPELEFSFLDIDLINQYMDYRYDIDALNHDFKTINRANDILREVRLSGKIDDVSVKANEQDIIKNLSLINKRIVWIDKQTKLLLCIVRVKMRHEKFIFLGFNRWKKII